MEAVKKWRIFRMTNDEWGGEEWRIFRMTSDEWSVVPKIFGSARFVFHLFEHMNKLRGQRAKFVIRHSKNSSLKILPKNRFFAAQNKSTTQW